MVRTACAARGRAALAQSGGFTPIWIILPALTIINFAGSLFFHFHSGPLWLPLARRLLPHGHSQYSRHHRLWHQFPSRNSPRCPSRGC
ncbi:hypothetical protein DESPIGER_0288 [Desulfovibrio piger]|uniref:Uncharacterized protein n=1 Tax=Desulfovibrio piger TaxID=901 RepID=A0A1K1LBU8_9BACT|nr:hypothetical protein DESPIGER_0288 [Desulfovibrio piger]